LAIIVVAEDACPATFGDKAAYGESDRYDRLIKTKMPFTSPSTMLIGRRRVLMTAWISEPKTPPRGARGSRAAQRQPPSDRKAG
jgi:hypothetical protein